MGNNTYKKPEQTNLNQEYLSLQEQLDRLNNGKKESGSKAESEAETEFKGE
ncbi:MAG: hypothetical protein N4A49_11295 [Marinifilaceae bacterium]|jgi:hypothetical protein|nr:hypothetical protein [Marinifilaceae bacterium]